MGRILDWLDEITGYDRRAIRAIALIIVVGALWLAVDTFVFHPSHGRARVSDPALEATIQALSEKYLPTIISEMNQLPQVTATPPPR